MRFTLTTLVNISIVVFCAWSSALVAKPAPTVCPCYDYDDPVGWHDLIVELDCVPELEVVRSAGDQGDYKLRRISVYDDGYPIFHMYATVDWNGYTCGLYTNQWPENIQYALEGELSETEYRACDLLLLDLKNYLNDLYCD